ncbi:hypothetical protein ACHAWC_001036 [Mediolabrus comicus]
MNSPEFFLLSISFATIYYVVCAQHVLYDAVIFILL